MSESCTTTTQTATLGSIVGSTTACTKQHVGRVLSTAKHAVRTEDLRMAVRSELVAGDHVAFVNAHSAWSYTIGRVIKEATTNMGALDTQEPRTKKPRAKKNQPAASDVDFEVADANPQPNPEYIKGPAGAVVLVHLFHPVDDAGSAESAWADTDKEYRVTTTDVSHTKFPMTAVLIGPRTRNQTGKVFNELYGTSS